MIVRVFGCDYGYLGRVMVSSLFFFQAEDGIRDLVRSRGLGDVYKRQALTDVQSAVSRINTFPQDMERPVVSQIVNSDLVCLSLIHI